jgi:hypothetical protein
MLRLFAVVFLIGFSVCSFGQQAKVSSFESLSADKNWNLVFNDDCTQNWQTKWFLDGEIARVENSEKGMHLKAGPEFGNDAHHMVLWTSKSFKGDVKIEFEYTRTDQETKAVNILYIQATGNGEGDFADDIFQWNKLRTTPSMRTYFNHMKLLHVSFAAFPNNEETEDYVRARRYPVTSERGFGQLEIPPTYFDTGLFKTNESYKITVIKTDTILLFKVVGNGQTRIFKWDTNELEPLKEGRIGLRHMYTRSAVYKDFKVYEKEEHE